MKHKPPKDLAEDLDYFLRDLCVECGFCNQLAGEKLLVHAATVTADSFATAVLVAEGMKPDYEKAWFRKLKRAFEDRYGNSVSSQSYSSSAPSD